MQKRRAVRNAMFLLAACATAQAASLKVSIARTSPTTGMTLQRVSRFATRDCKVASHPL
jgi:hypothetical protein